jgi:hypothetical protein
MRRVLGLLVFFLVAGLGLDALAQTAYPSTPSPSYPQIGQAPMGGPSFDRDRRDRRDRRGRRDINILSAWYGVEGRACDATRDARRACENRSSCTIPATNRLCGDPVPNVVKVLTVWYRCGNRPPRSTTRGEGRYVGLRCD